MAFFLKRPMISVQWRGHRFKLRTMLLLATILSIVIWVMISRNHVSAPVVDEIQLRRQFPFTYKYIHTFKQGRGGGNTNLLIAMVL